MCVSLHVNKGCRSDTSKNACVLIHQKNPECCKTKDFLLRNVIKHGLLVKQLRAGTKRPEVAIITLVTVICLPPVSPQPAFHLCHHNPPSTCVTTTCLVPVSPQPALYLCHHNLPSACVTTTCLPPVSLQENCAPLNRQRIRNLHCDTNLVRFVCKRHSKPNDDHRLQFTCYLPPATCCHMLSFTCCLSPANCLCSPGTLLKSPFFQPHHGHTCLLGYDGNLN